MVTSLHNLTNDELIATVESALDVESELCMELLERFTFAVDEIERLNELLGAPE